MSISMVPAGAVRGGALNGGGGLTTGSTAATTVTGSRTGAAVPPMACARACKCSRRQLNSRLALTPASWAMAATDAPGARLRSISSCLNSSACRRRMSWGLLTRLSMCASIGYVHAIQAWVASPDRAHRRSSPQWGLEATLTIDPASGHRNVSYIHRPDLVGPVDLHAAQQVRVHRMLRVLLARVGLAVQPRCPSWASACPHACGRPPSLRPFNVRLSLRRGPLANRGIEPAHHFRGHFLVAQDVSHLDGRHVREFQHAEIVHL